MRTKKTYKCNKKEDADMKYTLTDTDRKTEKNRAIKVKKKYIQKQIFEKGDFHI